MTELRIAQASFLEVVGLVLRGTEETLKILGCRGFFWEIGDECACQSRNRVDKILK